MNSLERHLQIALIICVLGLSLAYWWAGTLTAQRLTRSVIHDRMQRQAIDLVQRLEAPDTALPLTDIRSDRGLRVMRSLSPEYLQPASGRYLVWLSASGAALLSPSLQAVEPVIEPLTPGEQRRGRLLGPGGEPWLLWAGGFLRSGEHFTLALLEDITGIQQRLRVLRWFFAGTALVMLTSLLTVQHFIVRRSLQQLDNLRANVRRLERGRLEALPDDVPREIQPLVTEFNRLLQRFDRRLRQSRNAAGNLAHSLKGPLSLLQHAADQGDAQKEPSQRLAPHVERIRQVLDSELRRARLAGRAAAGQRFDPQTELPSLCALVEQVYSARAIQVRARIEQAQSLPFDRQDMMELLGNLLDNGGKWASARVLVQVRIGVDQVYIDVDDDGPGCSAEQIRLMTERGVRLDESVAGHGLGLSIVRDVVEVYGGMLEFGRSVRLGGLQASVTLPMIG